MNFFVRAFVILCLLQTRDADALTIIGRVVDTKQQPLKNVLVRLSPPQWQMPATELLTDSFGAFKIINVRAQPGYIISLQKSGYLAKSGIYHPNLARSRDTMFLSMHLRQRSEAFIPTATIGKKDLGISFQTAVKRFRLDTSDCDMIEEPPGMISGIQAESGDSSIIFLEMERVKNFSGKVTYKDLLRKKITGIVVAFPDCRKIGFAVDFIGYMIQNPYCKRKQQ